MWPRIIKTCTLDSWCCKIWGASNHQLAKQSTEKQNNFIFLDWPLNPACCLSYADLAAKHPVVLIKDARSVSLEALETVTDESQHWEAAFLCDYPQILEKAPWSSCSSTGSTHTSTWKMRARNMSRYLLVSPSEVIIEKCIFLKQHFRALVTKSKANHYTNGRGR